MVEKVRKFNPKKKKKKKMLVSMVCLEKTILSWAIKISYGLKLHILAVMFFFKKVFSRLLLVAIIWRKE